MSPLGILQAAGVQSAAEARYHLFGDYFLADGNYYVPYLSAEGNEMSVLVDPPPAPPIFGMSAKLLFKAA